jgi:hypothetical protein
MELPINIMIVLAISLVVTILFITFAQESISDSKKQLDEFTTKTDDQTQRILTVKSISNTQIGSLAKDCYMQHAYNSIQTTECFVVLGEPTSLTNSAILQESTLNSSQIDVDTTAVKNAVRIFYNAALNKVIVTG